jgi:hypothetical protein
MMVGQSRETNHKLSLVHLQPIKDIHSLNVEMQIFFSWVMESRWANYNLDLISDLQSIKDIHRLNLMMDFYFSPVIKCQWVTEKLQIR